MIMPFIFTFVTSGALSWGWAYVLAFVLVVFVAPVRKGREVLVNFLREPAFWMLAAFGACYVIFDEISLRNIFYYCLLPLGAYAAGWCALEQGGGSPAHARDDLLGITLGFALYACLNFTANLGSGRGELTDFWTGEYRTATGSGFLNTMIFSSLVYGLVLEKRRWMKLLLTAGAAVCLAYSFLLGTRTQLLILAVVSLTALLLLRKEPEYRGSCGKILLAAGAALAAVWVCVRFDLFGIGEILGGTNLIARFTDPAELLKSDSQRLRQFLDGCENLYLHPLGGQKEQFYFHNMWLDIGRVSGLLPLVLMIGYQTITGGHMLRLARDRELETGIRCLILCVWLGVLINFWFEPVLEGCLNFYLAFCAINGLTDGLYRGRT